MSLCLPRVGGVKAVPGASAVARVRGVEGRVGLLHLLTPQTKAGIGVFCLHFLACPLSLLGLVAAKREGFASTSVRECMSVWWVCMTLPYWRSMNAHPLFP